MYIQGATEGWLVKIDNHNLTYSNTILYFVISQVKSANNVEVVQLNQRLSSAREKNDQLHQEKVCPSMYLCH